RLGRVALGQIVPARHRRPLLPGRGRCDHPELFASRRRCVPHDCDSPRRTFPTAAPRVLSQPIPGAVLPSEDQPQTGSGETTTLTQKAIERLDSFGMAAKSRLLETAALYTDETRRSVHLGPIAPAAGQLVSPTRLRFISKKRSGSLPGTTRSPTSRHVPSLTTAV